MTLRYRGKDSLSLKPGDVTLEFVKHSQDLHPALDPGELAARFRADSDQFTKAIERDISKHPRKKRIWSARFKTISTMSRTC